MHVEEQRWAPLSGSCAIKPGAFGWSTPPQTTQHDNWWEVMDREDHQFVLHADYENGKLATSYISRSCTEFAIDYQQAFLPVTQNPSTIDEYIDHGFGSGNPGTGKPARIIDIDISHVPGLAFSVILVPNYGTAARAWWWGYDATDDGITKIRAGQASGKFTADGIKKKLVSIARQPSGRFAFVMNELKPGDVDPHYIHGIDVDQIKTFVKGEGWGSHPADGIERRLVSVKRFQPGNWTILYVPKAGVDWTWFKGHPWSVIQQDCQQHNRRVVYMERYGDSPDLFTAVLVQNK